MEKRYKNETYIICHNGSDIIHPSHVKKGTLVSSGQPYLEEFDNPEQWKERLTGLGYDTLHLDEPSKRDKLKALGKRRQA